jgi:hypothetical protein
VYTLTPSGKVVMNGIFPDALRNSSWKSSVCGVNIKLQRENNGEKKDERRKWKIRMENG